MARLLQAISALASSTTGRSPRRASSIAAKSPTGPAPTTATAARSAVIRRRSQALAPSGPRSPP